MSATATQESVKGKIPVGSEQRKRVVKHYDHVMSDQEKFAVGMVIQARKACNAIIESIKSGNGTTGKVLQTCANLSAFAVEASFGEVPKTD